MTYSHPIQPINLDAVPLASHTVVDESNRPIFSIALPARNSSTVNANDAFGNGPSGSGGWEASDVGPLRPLYQWAGPFDVRIRFELLLRDVSPSDWHQLYQTKLGRRVVSVHTTPTPGGDVRDTIATIRPGGRPTDRPRVVRTIAFSVGPRMLCIEAEIDGELYDLWSQAMLNSLASVRVLYTDTATVEPLQSFGRDDHRFQLPASWQPFVNADSTTLGFSTAYRSKRKAFLVITPNCQRNTRSIHHHYNLLHELGYRGPRCGIVNGASQPITVHGQSAELTHQVHPCPRGDVTISLIAPRQANDARWWMVARRAAQIAIQSSSFAGVA